MAHKDRESEISERSGERRHRSKSERESGKSSKPKSSRPKLIDPETGLPAKSRRRRTDSGEADKVKKRVSEPNLLGADLVPELSRTSSRISLPYPSFNRIHSKQALRIARDDLKLPTDKVLITPQSTDLGSREKLGSESEQLPTESKHGRPPSPPETDVSGQNKPSPRRMSQIKECAAQEEKAPSKVSLVSRSSRRDEKSKLSLNSKLSEASNVTESSITSDDADDNTQLRLETCSAGGSNATTVPPKVTKPIREEKIRSSSSTATRSSDSAKVPTEFQSSALPPIKAIPPPFIHFKVSGSVVSERNASQLSSSPTNASTSPPCVDYLLENGGLLLPVRKTLLAPPGLASQQSSSRKPLPIPDEVERIFGPSFSILSEYETVLRKNGSLAVATGYRSVARRLLDRLEVVMGRDLSSEGCPCVMCQHVDLAPTKKRKKLGWGEVLEWSSGRKELPAWPAFDFATLGASAAKIAGLSHRDPSRPDSPVKVDPDIADEFCEYYLQQTKKTKLAVDRWLSSCSSIDAAQLEEVDDETLSIVLLTHLDQHDRPIFNALITGSTILQPVTRTLNPPRKSRSDFMMRTVQSIQRLYRLSMPPAGPEVAIYLLKHPHLHDLLATISKISSHEWEILTSGRFDGFLWSGADTENSSSLSTPHGAMPSGTNQSGQTSRNTTSMLSMGSAGDSSQVQGKFAHVRRPVLNDEETEIAVLAEVEREIYLGMEALEDAFESLHRKAEKVRCALRERAVGLNKSLQSRQLSCLATDGFSSPNLGLGSGYGRRSKNDRSETRTLGDWNLRDDLSELAPDDSASNISSSRHRRPKRRNERITPALVEEEDEE